MYFYLAAGRQDPAASQALLFAMVWQGLWDKVTKVKADSGSSCSPYPLHKTAVPTGYIQNYLYILTLYLKDLSN